MIEKLFNPKTVTFIGATEREGSIGQQILHNLLNDKDKRAIYPVNPKREILMGVKCYPNVAAISKHIDLAVIATPAKTVPKIVDECGQVGVDGIVIISAGFGETEGNESELAEEVRRLRVKYDMRVLGPKLFRIY